VLAIFFMFHITVTRFMPLLGHGTAHTLSHFAFSIEFWPIIFYPYLFCLAFGAIIHFSYGIFIVFNRLPSTRTYFFRVSLLTTLLLYTFVIFRIVGERDLSLYPSIANENVFVKVVTAFRLCQVSLFKDSHFCELSKLAVV